MIDIATSKQQEFANILAKESFTYLRKIYIPIGESASKPLDSRCLVYSIEGEVLAMVSYYLEPPYVRLFRLAVAEKWRGQGLARKLVDYVVQYVAWPQAYDLALYTIEESGNAEIFSKLGFVVCNRTIADFAISPNGNEVYELEMRLNLRKAVG